MGDATTRGSKLKILWRGIFPPAETLRRIYGLEPGSNLECLYYVVRPLDLLIRRGRRVFDLLIGSPESRSTLEQERRQRTIRTWTRGKAPEV